MSEPWEHDVEAACVVAREVGLSGVTPVVLHRSGRTSVRLAPWPIVARVLSAFDLEEMAPSAARELRAAQHLAARGAPTVRPTVDPPPGPYVVGKANITLWTFVEHRKAVGRGDVLAAGHALAAMQSALRDLSEDLPPFTLDFDRCAAFLADQSELRILAGGDRAFLAERIDTLRAPCRWTRRGTSRCTATPTSATC